MTSDDETLNLIVHGPGDEAVRVAEASVGDLRSALKRAARRRWPRPGRASESRSKASGPSSGSSSPPASPTSAPPRRMSRRSPANCRPKPITNAKGRAEGVK